ncbi:unnamed protein product, partial [Tetraodon nigroviridis]
TALGSHMQCAGCSVLAAVCWLQCAGCSVLDAVCWLQCAGCSVLDAVCWMQCAGCSVLDAVCWMQCAGSVQSTFSPCSGLSRCFWLLSLSSTIKPSHTMEWACWQFIQISHDDGL